jgi:hypothetical protein
MSSHKLSAPIPRNQCSWNERTPASQKKKNTKIERKVLERINEERGCCEGQGEECNQQKGGYVKLTARTAGSKNGGKK